MKRWLITGIPGTGKTTLGDLLAKERGFVHYNLEDDDLLTHVLVDPPAFIRRVEFDQHDAVITWGFDPVPHKINLVLLLKEHQFKLLWFDGNREAAFLAFQRRGTVPDLLFRLQVQNIDRMRVIEQIDPTVYDPFLANGKFKRSNQIIGDLESAGAPRRRRRKAN